jgi:hypothetical protein
LIEHDLFGKPLHTFPDHALEHDPVPTGSPLEWPRAAGLVLEATCSAEIVQEIDGMTLGHIAQIGKAPVGLGIGIHDFLSHLFGLFDDLT